MRILLCSAQCTVPCCGAERVELGEFACSLLDTECKFNELDELLECGCKRGDIIINGLIIGKHIHVRG